MFKVLIYYILEVLKYLSTMDLLDKILDEMEEGCDTPSTMGRPHIYPSSQRIGLRNGWTSDVSALGESLDDSGKLRLSL